MKCVFFGFLLFFFLHGRDQRVLQQPLPERRDVCGGAKPAALPLPAGVERGRLPAPHTDGWVAPRFGAGTPG